jgi:hypothetical protein
MKPHKHAELIKAWADGAVIQFKSEGTWLDTQDNEPFWDMGNEYRIKPEEKQPVVRWLWAYKNSRNEWFLHGNYMTEDESKSSFPNEDIKRLEYTRTEFPE